MKFNIFGARGSSDSYHDLSVRPQHLGPLGLNGCLNGRLERALVIIVDQQLHVLQCHVQVGRLC